MLDAAPLGPKIDEVLIRRHLEILHSLASPLTGRAKLVITRFGEDPDTPDPETGVLGCPLATSIAHFPIGDIEASARTITSLTRQQHSNVYAPLAIFRADLPRGAKGAEKDIVGMLGLVADFDDAAAARWSERLPIAPNYVLETSAGRFQAFYLFNKPEPLEAVKSIAQRLKTFAGCDHGTADLSHVWRIAGTLNWPNSKKVTAGRPRQPQLVRVAKPWAGDLVALADLAAALPAVVHRPKADTPRRQPGANTDQRPAGADQAVTGPEQAWVNGRMAFLPTSLVDKIRMSHALGTRSKALYAVIAGLIEAGKDDATIERIIRAHPAGIGAKYVGRSDLDKEIARVRSHLAKRADNESWYSRCITGAKGQVLGNLANALLALRVDPQCRGVLEYDEMLGTAMLCRPVPRHGSDPQDAGSFEKRPVRDDDVAAIQEWLQIAGIPTVGKDTTHSAVDLVARENSFHPVREYLDQLVWDGTERLPSWLHRYLGVEPTEYATVVGTKFMISLVARIYRPGCKCDYILILQGAQGAKKSSACQIIGGEWFSDNMPENLASKDASHHIRGKWLIELAELHALNRSEMTGLKAFLTRRTEIYRPSYGRKEVHEPRQVVFIGTTNKSAFLRDETGGRRFWPVTVGQIDLDVLAADREQLLAEAVARYRRGERWWPTAEFERAYIAPEQEARYEVDAWEDLVETHLNKLKLDDPTKAKVTVLQLARDVLSIETPRLGTLEQRRITAALERAGWRHGTRTGSARWWVPASDTVTDMTRSARTRETGDLVEDTPSHSTEVDPADTLANPSPCVTASPPAPLVPALCWPSAGSDTAKNWSEEL